MKILRNIPTAFHFYRALPSLRTYKKEILAARARGDFETERAFILKATSAWGRRMMESFGTAVRIRGAENIPSEGPVVYAANHQGYADIPVCCFVLNRIQLGFIAKENLSKVPLYGEWINNIRSVMLRRDDPREALKAIDKGISYINEGFSLLIFPEGTRSKGGPMTPFKKGSLRLASKPGVPVVPVTLDGTWRIFEEKGFPQKTEVTVTIHKAIPTAALSRQEAAGLTETVERIVRSALPGESCKASGEEKRSAGGEAAEGERKGRGGAAPAETEGKENAFSASGSSGGKGERGEDL